MKTHIPWFPADYLGAVVFQYIPENRRDEQFPLSKIHDENPTNDFLYANYSPEQIVGFYDIQAKAIWPGLQAFIKYAVHDKQDFIVEGYQITPELISQLDEETKKSITPVFIYKKDVADIEEGIKKNVDPGDWLIKNTQDSEIFGKVAAMISLYGEKTLRESQNLGISAFCMDGDFKTRVDEVVDHLASAK